MSDHVHLCLSIPPKYSVANTVGFLSAIRIPEYLGRTRNFTGFHFWARGYCVTRSPLFGTTSATRRKRKNTKSSKTSGGFPLPHGGGPFDKTTRFAGS